jgi:cytochrome d ubiquinol oxidase subunit II
MDLNSLWFILVTILFIGFFFLEGFDYGVGILLPFLGKKDDERRVIINSIGPVWDGNEVWMITAGGALFASFPHVYATLFSGFYLALVLMLVALILRGVAFEFRAKHESQTWHALWDGAIFTGSLLPAFLWGVTVANLMHGFSIEQDMNYYGGLLPLLNPYALLGGGVFVTLFTMHGSNYLVRKVSNGIAERAQKAAFTFWMVTTFLTVLFLGWTFFNTDILTKPGINGLLPAILATISLLCSGWLIRAKKTGWAFVTGSLTIVFATAMVFMGLYPRLLVSSLDPSFSLTISNASSSPYTLKVMTIVAAIFVPIVLVYQAWTYRIFRKRVNTNPEDLTY